ncbi:MAG: asparagine synthase (glutamine-hydrolyzing) [Acidobacteria bacterium RIFCSPLOWO2_12_FULL_65_11]|nr:MAG: asparagine synthase (glutamine-hydrolyzing) [Acidobacteria bacterium RIFCSPLOWO2_02_FULL_64_15]OFW30374.1 MAG: asparagine synthase (glutamine-hydrolyzing) [Acidobacteria bacterium RIFCSPLOWO2_12_FULL_65_11]
MCGIAGLVRRDGPIESDPSPALGAALAHRGPDGHGVWCSPRRDVVLVHRRLAIIDPSPAGAQPMSTSDGLHHIVFNGEVYNHRELRRSLESQGELFSTRSDTEVLLRLLVREGPSALARVRGMFALAWWDMRERALVIARDRFGIKPLYVAAGEEAVAFASEIRALVSSGLVSGTVDPAGVLAYLAWGSVPPSLTWAAGVESLTPGTWRRWRSGRAPEEQRFASPTDAHARPSTSCDQRELKDRTREAVEGSVVAHLVADVPVGLFLSGGIDSSAILSAAAHAGVSGLRTFTVRFDDGSSEHEYARLVASAFGAEHRELVVDPSHVVADLPRILGHLDQPTLDAVNSFYVSQAVASTGIKAVLSGTGGDELFGGYPSFRRLPAAVRWKRRLRPVVPALSSVVAAGLPERLSGRWQHFMSGNGGMNAAYRAQRGLFMPSEIEGFAGPALRDRWRPAADRLLATESAIFDVHATSPAGEVAGLETRMYLCSQLLRDLDAMSMAHSLEVRVPLVDHVLVDAVWPDLGAHPSLMRNKRLLHETLARPLPPASVERPKQGFILPFERWIGGELEPFVRDGMRQLAAGRWISADAPDRVWQAWREGRAHWTRPWSLAVLGHFL